MDNETQVVVVKPAIMTVKDVAEYLRMSEAKVYRLVKEGVLPVVRIGKTWRFRKDLLDQWLKDCSTSEIQERRERNPDA
jgi:excisionase family DNA binding protein